MLWDDLWGGSEGPAGTRTEEAHPLREVPRLGGTAEEGGRTREVG